MVESESQRGSLEANMQNGNKSDKETSHCEGRKFTNFLLSECQEILTVQPISI